MSFLKRQVEKESLELSKLIKKVKLIEEKKMKRKAKKKPDGNAYLREYNIFQTEESVDHSIFST